VTCDRAAGELGCTFTSLDERSGENAEIDVQEPEEVLKATKDPEAVPPDTSGLLF